MLRRLVERARGAVGKVDVLPPIDYEASKGMARDQELSVRVDLARRQDVRPEVLYYLAEDPAHEVRREVAANRTTPSQADLLLTDDAHDDVRCEMARKIGRLLPELSDSEQVRVRELTLDMLEALAQDQLPRVRAILAEELKLSLAVPKSVIRRLARDVEEIVAAPILEYSPLLSDDDLLEIITSGMAQGTLSAIARRDKPSEQVSDAIVATLDVPAVAALLRNPSAQVREDTLDKIIESAPDVEAWHEPLVMRADLSVRAVRRIATFVARSLVATLARNNALDAETELELKWAVENRLQENEQSEPPADRPDLRLDGPLDDKTIGQALDIGDRDFVIRALARTTAMPVEKVTKILQSDSPPAVTALAWRGGLSMRVAIRVQRELAKIPPQSILNAKDGVDYPLSEDNMRLQLEMFAG